MSPKKSTGRGKGPVPVSAKPIGDEAPAAEPLPARQPDEKENQKKWGKEVWAAGWTAVPYVLIAYQRRLGIDAAQMNVLLHIMKRWWYADNPPYLSKAEIAKAMDTSERTVQRALSALRNAGYLEQKARKRNDGSFTTPTYDLSGLRSRLQQYANEELSIRKDRADREVERRSKRGRRAATPTDSAEGNPS